MVLYYRNHTAAPTQLSRFESSAFNLRARFCLHSGNLVSTCFKKGTLLSVFTGDNFGPLYGSNHFTEDLKGLSPLRSILRVTLQSPMTVSRELR